MFSRLYVLIQENLNNFNIEGVYSENEIYKRKYNLLNINPYNKYIIRGPFSIDANLQNNAIPFANQNLFNNNGFVDNNSYNQNNNLFNQNNNLFNQNNNLFNQNQFYNRYKMPFKINNQKMDLD